MAASKKGFISILGIFILNISLSFLTMMTHQLQIQLTQNEELALAELQAIQISKKAFESNEKENLTINYLSYELTFHCEEETCFIKVFRDNVKIFTSKIGYQASSKTIIFYEYQNKSIELIDNFQ